MENFEYYPEPHPCYSLETTFCRSIFVQGVGEGECLILMEGVLLKRQSSDFSSSEVTMTDSVETQPTPSPLPENIIFHG